MESSTIRRTFLTFFEDHGHRVQESASLLPSEPGLLFNIAGMVPFIPYFTGDDTPPSSRITTAQKCLRTEDIERVGSTKRHLTFFEMLGNFSFGDYFKQRAITLAWEFMTGEMGLDPDRLWITVFRGDEDRGLEADEEAEELWVDAAEVDPERVLSFGVEENFWSMAETGPCGPCSEILYDQEGGATPGEAQRIIEADKDRILELWNLVFMQFHRDESGTMTPLPEKNIDTGLGLERLAAVKQKSHSNFDTDLFRPLIDHTRQLAELPPLEAAGEWKEYQTGPPKKVPEFPDHNITGSQARDHLQATRIVADHVRAASFLLAEGLLPGNEGRGYVLRRLIRRALRWGRRLDLQEPFLHELVPTVVDVMGEHYGELAEEQQRIRETMRDEEEQFLRTLDEGMRILRVRIEDLKADLDDGELVPTMPGEEIFELYETHGFPVEITLEILDEKGIGYDESEIEAAREAHRARSSSDIGTGGPERSRSLEDVPETERLYLEEQNTYTASGAEVVALFDETGDRVNTLESGQDGDVVLDRTLFYPEGGGQVGDRGRLDGFEVRDTQSQRERVIHRGEATEFLEVGRTVDLKVDRGRRRPSMRHHTGTHLLQAALREELGDRVMQDGSLVAPDTLRFDFTFPEPVDFDTLRRVEDRVNAWIYQEHPVVPEYMDRERAEDEGALAFFGEHYGERVRVVRIGGGEDTPVSLELCGGTHLEDTGELGVFVITNETSVAAGVRRIEALAGDRAYDYLETYRERMHDLTRRLGVQRPEDVPRRIEELEERLDRYEGELERLRQREGSRRAQRLADEAETIEGLSVVVETFEEMASDTLKPMLDEVRERLEDGAVLFVNRDGETVQLLLGVCGRAAEDIHAGEWVGELGEILGGGGGGRPDFAEAGGPKTENVDRVLERFRAMVRERHAAVSGD